MSNSASQETGKRNVTLQSLAVLLILGIATLIIPSRRSQSMGKAGSTLQITNTARQTNSAQASTEKGSVRFAKQAARVNEAQTTFTQAAIRDGEMLIERPVPEYLMVYRTLTNSGIPADTSKAQLRPILKEVFTVSECNRMLASDVEKLSTLFDEIRSDPDRSNAEKAMLIDSLATNFEQFRLKIRKQRDEHLQVLSEILGQLGTTDPDDLLRKVLLAEPVTPPPDSTE